MSRESYYTQSIPIHRNGSVTKSALNADVTTPALHITVMGRIRPMSGREQAASMRDNVMSTHLMYCATVDIVVGDFPIYGGVTYRVNFVKDPMSMGKGLEIEMSVKQS